MNDHANHIVCFIRSEISMNLTEIPEFSANCVWLGKINVQTFVYYNLELGCGK